MKKKFIIVMLIAILITLILLVPFGNLYSQPGNLIPDGDFQEGNIDNEWSQAGTGGLFVLSGSYYAKLRTDDTDGIFFTVLTQTIAITSIATRIIFFHFILFHLPTSVFLIPFNTKTDHL